MLVLVKHIKYHFSRLTPFTVRYAVNFCFQALLRNTW